MCCVVYTPFIIFLFQISLMLQELSIKNFAIIDDLHILFSDGLTIISGETGAGKSIIINAVNLLLGSRASAKLVRTGAKNAEIEALFKVAPESMAARGSGGSDLDSSGQLSIRRIIAGNNRHRIYINGHIATIQTLISTTENLASISGQYAHQGLLKEDQHLLILDQFGGLAHLRNKVTQCYHGLIPLIKELDTLKSQKERQTEHLALLEFQKKEITDAAIKNPEEDEELEKEKIKLKNSELIHQIIYGSIEELYSSRGAVVEKLVEIKKNMDKASAIDPIISDYAESISNFTFKIEDLVEDLRGYLNNITVDDLRLENIEERLYTLQKLKQKYGGTLDGVGSYLKKIDKELSGIENISDRIDAAGTELDRMHKHLAELAVILSEKRKTAANHMAQKVEEELSTLKMAGTKFELSLKTIKADEKTEPFLAAENSLITETGIDQALFLIAPNVGEKLKPLAQIASGGELSRMILAIKAILAKSESVETIIFDEVDSGVGGDVAEVVGKKLHLLAHHHQIICITHLPQIARFGDHHFKISKDVENGRTITSISPVNNEERVKEMARMMGGEKITRAILDHAKEMLDCT